MAFVRDAEEVAPGHTVGGLAVHLQTTHMANVEADARRLARDWLLKVKDSTRLSWTAIAREAGIAPSTLTKAVNDPDHPHILSTGTIAKISRAFKIPAPGAYSDDAMPAIAAPEAAPYAFDGPAEFDNVVRAFVAARPEREAWQLSTRALELVGYVPGDVVIIDRDVQPQAGDVVCAQVYDFRAVRAQLVWRRYQPPFLFAASASPELVKPLPADDAAIQGTVVMSFRPRSGGD